MEYHLWYILLSLNYDLNMTRKIKIDNNFNYRTIENRTISRLCIYGPSTIE